MHVLGRVCGLRSGSTTRFLKQKSGIDYVVPKYMSFEVSTHHLFIVPPKFLSRLLCQQNISRQFHQMNVFPKKKTNKY